jgi:type I restriction enzyme S subunit
MTDTTKSARKSWAKVAFGDVVQLARERSSDPEADGHERFIGLEHIDPGDLRVRRWGNIADGVTFTNVFKPGQVLFGKRRAYQRKVAVADFGGVCSSDIYVLEPKGEGLLPELLPFICQTDAFFEHAVGTSAGSLSPRTNWDSLASFEFALPPIEEQRRVVKAMREVDRLIDSLVDGIDQGYRCYQAVLRSSFPSSGQVILSGELCPFITSGSRGWAKYYSETGATFFRITNMRRKSIRPDWSDIKYVSAPSDGEAARTRVQPDDVLISVTADVGMVTLVTKDFPTSHVNQHIAILRPDIARVNPQFLAYYLASEFGDQQFRRFNDHGAKAGLNLENLAALSVPDVPRDVQDEVVRRALALDEARSAIAERLDSAKLLRKQMLIAAVLEEHS